MDDREQATNYAEYSYEKAVTGKDRLHRFLYITGAVFLMILPILIAVFLHKYFIMYIMPLVVILGVPFTKFFYRYLQYEYKYTVDRRSFRMELIHGKAKPKTLLACDVTDMEYAVPARDLKSVPEGAKIYRCCVSDSSPDLYAASFRDASGKPVLLYFEGSKKALRIMNYYNKNIVIDPDLRH